ncbi:hypothetical protein RRG08_011129 [Elysia crispata]|uniref:Uncharacterized protein n=1 Tax=Elysia crispata TaxID=231223 RepID=A0AAE1A0P6_9GAST|nr:hypothetical protein RRG08_011129 [Elysia crispata]
MSKRNNSKRFAPPSELRQPKDTPRGSLYARPGGNCVQRTVKTPRFRSGTELPRAALTDFRSRSRLA